MHALVSEAQTVMAAQGDAGGKAETMREIPVLFNGAMVRAILDDRKTQTRRIVKPQPWQHPDTGVWWIGEDTKVEDLLADRTGVCKYLPGDRLWVREAHAWVDYLVGSKLEDPVCVAFAADNRAFSFAGKKPVQLDTYGWPWDRIKYRPSIHMPRWAARLFTDVVDVRIERLCDISEEDARAEGADRNEGKWVDEDGRTRSSYRLAFQRLWISVYGTESWAANPWVWVTTFRKVP